MNSRGDNRSERHGLVDQFRAGELNVYVYESRALMGAAASEAVAGELRRLVGAGGRAVAIFASAPSQNEFLESLTAARDVDWRRVVGFHLDEYLGMGPDEPQSFRRFLVERLVSKVPIGEFHGLRGEADDADEECERYAALLDTSPPDIGVLGVGENGHLAFIDPPYCDFDDPRPVRVVDLDEVCREQQVHDGAFATIDAVPHRALSLTIPTIIRRPKLFAVVPGPAKSRAVKDALEGPVATSCPASILRQHPDAHLFLDRDSAALLTR